MLDRISRKELEEIECLLSDKDKNILRSVWELRYLTTNQIRRLYFTEATTESAGLRAASRTLKKLKEMKLIAVLDRRIGGVRSGSGSYIWHMDAAGDHLLRLMESNTRPRRRFFEPSTYFLAHTIAVSECHIRLTEICNDKNIKLTEISGEPDNWRPMNSGGKITSLKPDLFAVTVCGSYEDRWFIEVDLDTESPAKIIDKCRRYHQYYQSGLEQKQYGVFPMVVWIVPDSVRKERIRQCIHAEFSKLPNIFVVVTPDELEALICQGADGGTPC